MSWPTLFHLSLKLFWTVPGYSTVETDRETKVRSQNERERNKELCRLCAVLKPHSWWREIRGDADDSKWAAGCQKEKKIKEKSHNPGVACTEKMIFSFLWCILIGIGFAQLKFSCAAELALYGLLVVVVPRLPWQRLPCENWWPWYYKIIRKSSVHPQNYVFPSSSSAQIRRHCATGADTACKCPWAAESRGGSSLAQGSPAVPLPCCKDSSVELAQCGTRKQSFCQERDLLPRDTRSAVVDTATERDLWGKSEAVLHQETRVIISAAIALHHTGQV